MTAIKSVFHKDISFRLEKLDNQRLGIGLFRRFRRHKKGRFDLSTPV